MTLIFSSVSDKLIVMSTDSAITNQFEDHNEYVTGLKSYLFQGVGCVTTWGERSGNRIAEFLSKQNISPQTHSVKDLADLVNLYLTTEYRPRDYDLGEVGYHVGGFDRDGQPCLFHIFWGFDRPKPPEQIIPEYRYYPHSDDAFLYNGRNDLADAVVHMLIEQVKAGEEVRFNLTTLAGLVGFCDFVVRFAAEMTPQVGPPFHTPLIFRDNSIETIRNDSFCPIDLEDRTLKRLDAAIL